MVACWSINMRIFKTAELIILLLTIVRSSKAAPLAQESSVNFDDTGDKLPPSSSIVDVPPQQILGDRYDQRQNGTENYRVHVDGLVLVFAPIEGLLLAGGLPGLDESAIFGTGQPDHVQKPKPDESSSSEIANTDQKPPSAKSSHSTGLRLINLLSPFLRRAHHPHH